MEIVSINIGKPKTIKDQGKELQSGIYKTQTNEPIFLGKLNFDGDGQADLVHHGGEDKAVCVYPYEHYPHWEKDMNRELVFGAFGENLTLKGMLESDVHVGDIYRLGAAMVQISQPRQPCFKLAKRYDISDLPLRFQNTGYTGFYFRVLKEGWVQPDSRVEIIEKHPKQISIQWANHIMHHNRKNMEEIKKILAVDALSDSWRKTFTQRSEGLE
ncbi:MOSC domain-containing protein [Bacillus sp. V3B]|uniref:MOSC domain-containing protein n=1 Tax=Bacillus sp. V3B TaxID=2804915 RepID=UPI002109F691|nr:MOSC domain-containing protein [Bacillus sp. V3B]